MRMKIWMLGWAAVAAGSAFAMADGPTISRYPNQEQILPPQPPQGGAPAVRPAQPPAAPPVTPPANSPAAAATNPPQFNLASQDPSTSMPMLRGAPRMIGDFPGYYGCTTVTQQSTLSTIVLIPTIIRDPQNPDIPPVTVNVPTRVQTDITEQFKFATLALSRGAFKIAENESPQPQDRCYITYNNFHQIGAPAAAQTAFLTLPANSPLIGTAGAGPFPLKTTLADTLAGTGQDATLTTTSIGTYDVHRETVGFEKTFFDGAASIGVRLPVFQSTASANSAVNAGRLDSFNTFPSTVGVTGFGNNFDGSRIGDVTVILKYAFVQDPDAERVISGGLVTTAPTGGGIPLADGSRMYSTILQPFVGGVQGFDRFFVHGFSSIAIPTDQRDLTLLFNDVGMGYYAFREPDAYWLTSIVPTIEAHVTTPLDNGSDGINGLDVLIMTGGVHFGIGQNSVLSFAAATPVTGPRPFQVEGAVQFNWVY